MGQLEDLQRNRIARILNIQKGFCDNDIEKAHQEGDIHPNGKWVWTKLPSGKYDWRVRKGQTKSDSSAPKPSGNDTGVDIAKIPNEEFKRITQTLEKKNPDHSDAERYLEEEAMSDKELKNFRAVAEHFKNSSKINKLTREYCRKWAELAEQEMQYRKKDKVSKQDDDKSKINQATKQQSKSASSSSAKKPSGNKSIDYDEDEYKRQQGIAAKTDVKSLNFGLLLVKTNLSNKEKELSKIRSERPGAKATIAKLENEVRYFNGQKKAFEEEIKKKGSENKPDEKKADLPFTDLTNHSQVIDYAKTIDGADFEEIDSRWGNKGSKAFQLNYNGGLKLDVDFLNNDEYIYTFRDKNDNPLYETHSTRHTDETDWSVMLNPRKWANLVKSNISKHISNSKAEQTRYFNLYNRTDKNSYYDKYLNAKYDIERLNKRLNKVDKILQLS